MSSEADSKKSSSAKVFLFAGMKSNYLRGVDTGVPPSANKTFVIYNVGFSW